MSEDQGGNQGPDLGSGGDGGNGGDGKQGFQPVTYKSQEELDAAFAERANRAAENARREALKGLPEGVKLTDLVDLHNQRVEEENKKKDPATKEREAREKAERELAAYKNKEVRAGLATQVAKDLKIGDTPIPASLLAGDTEDELKAHGAALIEFFESVTGPRPPRHNPHQGRNGDDSGPKEDPIRAYMATGQFA
jgi:hypothetical protein